jgi:hypothetical protein
MLETENSKLRERNLVLEVRSSNLAGHEVLRSKTRDGSSSSGAGRREFNSFTAPSECMPCKVKSGGGDGEWEIINKK